MLMNDKIIFDRYYCINSAETKEKKVQKRNKYGALYFTASSHFHTCKSFSFLCSFRADFRFSLLARAMRGAR